MRIAAFDPGINASAALLQHGAEMEDFETRFLDMVDLATVPDGENRQLDVKFIGDLLVRWDPDVAVVENVQAMPSIPGPDGARRSMGAASSFRFGMACGMIRATVVAYGVPLVMCHPRSWKNHFKLKGPDKKQDAALCKELYPSSVPFITLVKHHGRADAGLMAAWYADRHGML
jgi:hypothetical protein